MWDLTSATRVDQWSIPDAQVADTQTRHIVEQVKQIPQPPSVRQVVAMHITGDLSALTLYKH